MKIRFPTLVVNRKIAAFIDEKFVIKFVFAIMIFFVVLYIFQHQTGRMSPQSKTNLTALNNPSLLSAIESHREVWPPAYPMALWVFSHLGLPVQYFNLVCFYLLLILVWLFTRNYLTGVHPVFPAILVALTYSSYVNIYQQVSESLFVLLAFLIMSLLAQYRQSPTVFYAFLLGLFSSITVLTRFIGLFWVVPIVIVYMWILPIGRSLREKSFHFATYLGVLTIFIVPWLVRIKVRTGYITGMNRFSPRSFRNENAHWNEITDFSTNIKFTIKTVFIDFFSASRYASHKVVESTLLPVEYIAVAIFLILTILLILASVYNYYRSGYSRKFSLNELIISTKILPLHFAVVYVISLVVLWTIGNNDPVYTRFMYPSYVFIILSVFSLYSMDKEKGIWAWHKMPFYAIYIFFVALNLLRIISGLTNHPT